jgi:hypothetical protein
MGTSIGRAIDYLISGVVNNASSDINGKTLLQALQTVDKTVVLADNTPETTSQSTVFIGRAQPDDAETATATRQFIVLGAGRSQEEYDIPCYIGVARPGPAQKPARDAALALFDVVAHFISADLSLGGVLMQGRVANLSSANLTQTRDEEDTDDGAMRVAWVMFTIHCANHYIP